MINIYRKYFYSNKELLDSDLGFFAFVFKGVFFSMLFLTFSVFFVGWKIYFSWEFIRLMIVLFLGVVIFHFRWKR